MKKPVATATPHSRPGAWSAVSSEAHRKCLWRQGGLATWPSSCVCDLLAMWMEELAKRLDKQFTRPPTVTGYLSRHPGLPWLLLSPLAI